MMQPACTDRHEGLSGVAGRDRREKLGLSVLGDGEGKDGRQRPRAGSENDKGFVMATGKDLSDSDDTPEDEDEDEDAEFCKSKVDQLLNE